MNKLTLSDCKDEVADDVAGICSDDARIISMINQSQRRLMLRGKWVGTVQRYRINATSGQVTWPRQITTIEAVAFCDSPGEIRNGWHEFLGYGYGLLNSDDGWTRNLIDRGTACTHTEITAGQTNRRVRVYAEVPESATSYIIVQGYDENGNWIRRQVDGEWIDGEQILISTTPQLSVKKFTSVTGIIKPVTNGSVRIYEYNDTTAANVQQLGYYEPDETKPIYRRSLLPGIMDTEVCEGTEDSRYVTVAVKLRHIPVRVDNDWLILGNLDAIKLGVQAILKERRELFEEAQKYWSAAISELEKELREYQGDGAIVAPKIAPDFGGGNIATII